MAKHYRGHLYQARSKRYHSLTGNLPGVLSNRTGERIAFNKVLDVSAQGIGLEITRYIDIGEELVLTVAGADYAIEVVYCVSVPKEEIYRCGLKVREDSIDLVDLFRGNGCNYLVPIDSDEYNQLLYKKSG